MLEHYSNLLTEWLERIGFANQIAKDITSYSEFGLLILFCFLLYFTTKYILKTRIHLLLKTNRYKWDDVLVDKKVFIKLAYLAPLLILSFFTKHILTEIDYPITIKILNATFQILILVVSLSIVNSILNSFHAIYQTFGVSKLRPIKGYIQVIKIIIYIIALVFLISIFLGKNGFGWVAGFGAFSAILMLVFKDPILGFVGGIQLTSNDMVRIGDWISMPKFGADGNVTDITLTTVKVQNWDKTITTIPTYALVTDYFQNWRGMEESEGRRIKRSINIDMNSVKFCDKAMLDRFKKFHFIVDYIEKKNEELEVFNKKYDIDDTILVNGRRQTNLGIFRAYLKVYLTHKPEINKDMTFMVRQLQPTPHGIPMEIYVFSKVKEWIKYEEIQSDIFDHILAVIPQFELSVFQEPSGADFKKIIF